MQIRQVSGNSDSSSSILIFLGWGMDERPFANICKNGFAIHVAYGYDGSEDERQTYLDFLRRHPDTSVIAWSYGVCIANALLTGKENIAVAVCGAVNPVDNDKGIPERIFNLTLRSLSEASMEKFHQYAATPHPLPLRDLNSLAEELRMFGSKRGASVSPHWDIAYIGMKDRIIPASSQQRLWQDSTAEMRYVEDGNHYIPFRRIIDENIIDKGLVAKRFTDNTASYEQEAEVQQKVAAHLYGLWRGYQTCIPRTVLEIGCGTGFLTRLYCDGSDSTGFTAIDIARKSAITGAFRRAGIDFRGTVLEGDAEIYLHRTEERFGAVLSSSVIQWFNSPQKFFSNLRRILEPGGTAAVATYVKGTFRNMPQRSLRYHTAGELTAMIPDGLELLHGETAEHVITFNSAKELLSHIRDTGVNAVSSEALPAGQMRSLVAELNKKPELNFSTLYLILRKKQ